MTFRSLPRQGNAESQKFSTASKADQCPSKHPFEHKEDWEQSFPAQFIGEGLDQTRGWFYSLTVIATILFQKAPFQNLICNGLVLAEDGKKMSKRLKNYPEPLLCCASFSSCSPLGKFLDFDMQ